MIPTHELRWVEFTYAAGGAGIRLEQKFAADGESEWRPIPRVTGAPAITNQAYLAGYERARDQAAEICNEEADRYTLDTITCAVNSCADAIRAMKPEA